MSKNLKEKIVATVAVVSFITLACTTNVLANEAENMEKPLVENTNFSITLSPDSKDNLLNTGECRIAEIESKTVSPRLRAIMVKTFWMEVASTSSGVPKLSEYWHVDYVNGKKYEGWVYWTGEKRTVTTPSKHWTFQFSGTLYSSNSTPNA